MRSLARCALVLIVAISAGCRQAAVSVWQAMPLGTSADFRGVWFADDAHGWIAGGGFDIPGGLLGRTDNGGSTWRFTSGLIGGAENPRRLSASAVHFFDQRRGFIATDSGEILFTSDAGDTWEAADVSRRSRTIASMFFLDEQRGWALSNDGVLRTDDSGRTWTPMTAESEDAGNRVSGRAMHFLDSATGYIAGMHASLLRTTDGGVTWNSPTLPLAAAERPSFWDVYFVDAVHGWVVGEEGTLLTTNDAGATWARQNTGVADARSAPKLERIPTANGVQVIDAGDRTPGFTLSAVRFVDPHRGWAAGYYANLAHSLILATIDGGTTWTVEADIAGEDLRALFVQGREWIWAVGARTREGGQNIYRRPLSAPVVKK